MTKSTNGERPRCQPAGMRFSDDVMPHDVWMNRVLVNPLNHFGERDASASRYAILCFNNVLYRIVLWYGRVVYRPANARPLAGLWFGVGV
jgi:hypothetical protein